jgi:hypothetical protein
MKKEEQKQHLIDMMKDDENLGLYENWVEDAEKESSLSDLNSKANIFWSGFRVGVKSKERMYTEEDMEEAFENGLKRSFDSDFDRWFEQFKKK